MPWDPGSAAPGQLWRVGQATPGLRYQADFQLARLMVAGAEAGRVRAAVLGLLTARSEAQPIPSRVHDVACEAIDELTQSALNSRQSLDALLEREPDSFAALATLLATALTERRGQRSAGLAIEAVLDGMDAGHVTRDAGVRLLREMKTSFDRSRLPALGARLQRILSAAARRKDPRPESAQFLLDKFFATRGAP